MTIDLKAIRERRWPLSFHRRAARTVEEMREVVETLAALRKACDAEQGDIALLNLGNQVWANVELYGDQYVTRLLELVDRMRPYLRHKPAACSSGMTVGEYGPAECTCGLDALLRDIDGGGGR